MAAISDANVSIDSSGNIRWTGAATTPTHTVLEFIQFLMDKQDDAQAAGDDLLDITVDTPFNRSTDQILTLNSPFNIDDTFATHLYDGSVAQTSNGGETRWSGLNVIGPVETGTEYMILQNGKVLPAFWGTGINPEAAPSLVFSRHLVKSKVGGSKIDGSRITVLARELGDQYRRFPVTLGTGNSVAAIGNGSDIFNAKTEATLAGYTTITNVEGFQELDIDNTGAAGQEYYSQWNKAALTINDVYERSKWITQRSHVADLTTTAAGLDYVVDDGTIQGVAQSFVPLGNQDEILTEVRFQVKIDAGTPTGTLYCELWDSDDAGAAGSGSNVPTGSALARSEDVLASAITTSFEEVIFRFNRYNPTTGVDQLLGLTLDNTEAEYFMVIRNAEGDASNNFAVDGVGSDVDATQGSARDTSGTWGTTSVNDIQLTVKSSPIIHGLPGEIFQGINVEVLYDAEAGTGVIEDTILMWGTAIVYSSGAGGAFRPGEQITIKTGSTLKSGGEVLYDDEVDTLIVSLDTLNSLTAGDTISTVRGSSEATATIDSFTLDDLSGGEGILLAWDDNTGSGEAYLQVLSGANPVNNNLMRVSNLTEDPEVSYLTAAATIRTKTVSPEFLGTSTGSNIIGAYGIGFEIADVGSSDRFTSLAFGDPARVPPNNVVFTVSGLVAGEDRVLVAPRSGSAIDTTQLATDVTLSGAAETVVQCSTAVPSETPSAGSLRVALDSGISKRIRYESNSGNDYTILAADTFIDGDVDVTDGASGNSVNIVGHTFVTLDKVQLTSSGTLPAGLALATDYWIIKLDADNIQFAATVADAVAGTDVDITAAAGGGTHTITPWESVDASAAAMADFTGDIATSANNVFLTYIDTLARATTETYTAVHTSDRDLFVRVRDGGATPIKTFESASAQFLSTAQTVAAIRTSDA